MISFTKIIGMSRKKEKKLLVDAAPEYCFWSSDGAVFKNLKDLKDALKKMNKDVFSNHVNKEKNDFAIWVEEVFGETELAKKLKKAMSKTAAFKELDSYLKKYY